MVEAAESYPTLHTVRQVPVEAAEPLQVMMEAAEVEAAEVEAAEPLQLMMEAAEPLPPPPLSNSKLLQPLQTQCMEAVRARAVVEVLSYGCFSGNANISSTASPHSSRTHLLSEQDL